MTLIQIPGGVHVLPGCKFNGQSFNPAGLYTVDNQIRTPQGTVDQYDVTYPGVLIEPAATNKCTCRKVNPTDTSNLVKGGDAASVLSVVDYSAVLAAANLSNICTSGKVYKLDNSSGVDFAFAQITGPTTNINTHSISVYIDSLLGTGKFYIGNSNQGYTLIPAEFGCITYTGTPSSVVSKLTIYVEAGDVVHFIMPELVESSFLTSPIMPKPGEDDLTTVTRPADNVSFSTPSWLLSHPNDFAVIGTVIPGAAGQSYGQFCCSYADANNVFQIYNNAIGTSVYFNKRVAATSNVVFVGGVQTVGDPIQFIAYQSSIVGMGLATRKYSSGSWSAWTAWAAQSDAAGKSNAIIASTFRIGSLTSSSGFYFGNYPMTRILRIPTNLSAAGLQAWLKAKAEEGD